MSDFEDEDFDQDLEEADLEFTRAADHIQRTHNKRTDDELLQLYGLYKQATVGKCNTPKPGVFSLQARSKWNEWQKLGSMTSAEAKKLYIKKVAEIDSEYHNALQKPAEKSVHSWVVHSQHAFPEDDDEMHKPESEKTPFDFVKEGNLEKLRKSIEQSTIKLNELDEHGMGLIHWATDRNHKEILEFLLDSGADVNLRDADSQTALHFAASCGHLECVRVLIKYDADQNLKDSDGQTSWDVADCSEVRSFLSGV